METIIFVPGGEGSRLTLHGQEIWPPTLLEIIFGYHRIQELQDKHVKVTTVLDAVACFEVYKPLQDDLNAIAKHRGARRVDFPYDWRKDVFWSAGKLAARIASCVKNGSTTVTLVCHSMGNLLARMILESNNYCQESWFGKINKYVGICGPHSGVPRVLEYALGFRGSLGISPSDMKVIAGNASYPGGYQNLPFEGRAVLWDIHGGSPRQQNFYQTNVATLFGLSVQNLAATKNMQNALNCDNQPSGTQYVLIAGTGQTTDETVQCDGSTFHDTGVDGFGDGMLPLWSSTCGHLNPHVTPGDHIGVLKSYPFRQILYDVLTGGTLVPELSVADAAGVTLSLNDVSFAPHAPIDVMVIPDLRTERIAGSLQIMRVVDTKGARFLPYQELQVEYRGPQIRFINSRIFAPADPGAYRIDFTGSHRTSERTAGGFVVSRSSARR